MGMVISFTRVTPEELDRAEKDPDWAREFLWEVDELRPDNPEAYLDKAWAGLEFLLGKAGEPLEFLMDGYPVDDEGTLFSWGVEGVQALAKSLGGAAVGTAGHPLRPGSDDRGRGVPRHLGARG